ncbi:WASC3-like protein [Mya arenaria]|uniref:WASC3-like protein n=1 Tax=Mya arenaria TaxID=6604 RepID=A0ABY7EJA8_MYAAR|nr:WASC3-like protein [Mya arenaria]
MDEDGLPLVGPGVDYTQVEAINQKRIIAFVNHFVSHTAGFLNRFSCVCEEKLEQLSHRMQQLDITMSLLEAKINSIPGMENVTAPSGSTPAQSQPGDGGAAPPPSATPQAPPPPGAEAAPPPPPGAEAPPPPPEEPAPAANPGVPETAVKGKMAAEGLNPDLLDTPDAPAPAGGASKNDDFSSDEDNQSDDSSDFD